MTPGDEIEAKTFLANCIPYSIPCRNVINRSTPSLASASGARSPPSHWHAQLLLFQQIYFNVTGDLSSSNGIRFAAVRKSNYLDQNLLRLHRLHIKIEQVLVNEWWLEFDRVKEVFENVSIRFKLQVPVP